MDKTHASTALFLTSELLSSTSSSTIVMSCFSMLSSSWYTGGGAVLPDARPGVEAGGGPGRMSLTRSMRAMHLGRGEGAAEVRCRIQPRDAEQAHLKSASGDFIW